MNGSSFWMFLAGLGLFLYGMNTMERVLRKLSGRTFKLFLRRHTNNLFKAILGGALVTGLLQSSSLVGFMTLAFVGAGVISFRNALGIILGANLGTTLASWVVVAVGFKLDIESYSLPVVAVSTLAMFFLENRKRLYHVFQVFFAFGILFVGLGYMKVSALAMVGDFNFSEYATYGNWFFVLAGFILTSLIQSSSAAVAITLTALHTGTIGFPQAAAVVIGSEVGTTVKFILAGFRISAEKKRVVWGNFIFNMVLLLLAFVFLNALISFIRDFLGVKDVLIALVSFQSLINFFGILLFVPLISFFVKMLTRLFPSGKDKSQLSILRENIPVSQVGIDILKEETAKATRLVMVYIREMLDVDDPEKSPGFIGGIKQLAGVSGKHNEAYSDLKKLEGELLAFSLRLHGQELDRKEHEEVSHLVESIRYAIQAAKSIKDIRHNIKDFRESANDFQHDWAHQIRKEWTAFENSLTELLDNAEQGLSNSALGERLKQAYQDKETGAKLAADALQHGKLSSEETSTLLNMEREIFLAKRSLLNTLSLRFQQGKMEQAKWEQG